MGTISTLAHHMGFFTLINAPRDIHLIILLRCLRLSAFGAISLILVKYLKSVGIEETQIGLLLTLTFIGELIFSFILAHVSDRLGRRRIIILSSILMSVTGVLLYYFNSFWLLAIIMVIGIITPSGTEVGPFRSIEQSAISTLVKYEDRSDIFSWYTFSGGFSSGIGNFIIGYSLDKSGSDYSICFAYYSAIGIVLALISCLLSDKVEVEKDTSVAKNLEDDEASSSTPLLPSISPPKEKPNTLISYILPNFTEKSLNKLLLLTFLISLDSLGLSLSSKAWTVYYFTQRYLLDSASTGVLFGTASFIGAISCLIGTYFCKKYGPIRTMITSHSIASVLLIFHSLPINYVSMSSIFLIRAFVRTMDLPSKHLFISAVVEPSERTTAIGFINAAKTLVNTTGPIVSGYLASKDMLWLCFLIAGFLRLSYDFGLFIKFYGSREGANAAQ
ncbi:hypothetical protein WICMUC_005020 [Wickerhamomyces mucosus]|uniref:Major facilitator superfamily (MFS) profile domain-containing protein n=1 Tax=Wickerhamomyces mucosus TaxID=1378264 RepID=A0A9P8T7U2_9ASCO|nr:hypothetical protein WICMUC_005020 [Wickerhamomyces mucosus]